MGNSFWGMWRVTEGRGKGGGVYCWVVLLRRVESANLSLFGWSSMTTTIVKFINQMLKLFLRVTENLGSNRATVLQNTQGKGAFDCAVKGKSNFVEWYLILLRVNRA